MSFVIECWSDLESCRPLGPMGAGPIPWTAIVEWCRFQRAGRDLTMLVADAIRYLDAQRADRITSEIRQSEAKAKARR